MGLSLRQVSEAEWEAWAARSVHLVQEKKTEAVEDIEVEPARGEDTTASEQGEQSEADVERTPAAEREEEIVTAQISGLREGATFGGDPVEEELPDRQPVGQSVPVSEGFWSSFVEER